MSDGFHRAVPTDEPAGGAGSALSAGIVCAVGVVVVVGLLAALAYLLRRRKRKAAARRAHDNKPPRVPPASPPPPPVTPPLVRDQQTGAATGGHGDGAEDVADAAGDDRLLCGMCRSAYGGVMPETLDCGHRFHRRCVRPWLRVNLACPTCNATHIKLCGEADGEASTPSRRL